MRILWHNANPLELLNPENGWPWHCPTTYLKAEKAIYHLNDIAHILQVLESFLDSLSMQGMLSNAITYLRYKVWMIL